MEGPMKFNLYHNSIGVFDLERSLKFYEEALGMKAFRTIDAPDGSFRLVFVKNEDSSQSLELTWIRDKKEPYDLGDNELHMGFRTDDYAAAYEKHKAMGVICFENKDMGIYFIEDPDGYWLEIVPER